VAKNLKSERGHCRDNGLESEANKQLILVRIIFRWVVRSTCDLTHWQASSVARPQHLLARNHSPCYIFGSEAIPVGHIN
jgi:hypothetical protein